jgi:hypothetical protein
VSLLVASSCGVRLSDWQGRCLPIKFRNHSSVLCLSVLAIDRRQQRLEVEAPFMERNSVCSLSLSSGLILCSSLSPLQCSNAVRHRWLTGEPDQRVTWRRVALTHWAVRVCFGLIV